MGEKVGVLQDYILRRRRGINIVFVKKGSLVKKV